MVGLSCLMSQCAKLDVGIFHTRLFGVGYFAIASVREFLDTTSYYKILYIKVSPLLLINWPGSKKRI
jgi:hypothetical protein